MSFVTLHPEWETPLYQQLYQAIREAIESGALASGTRMPSIRRLPEELGVSRTTVEAAYQQLCVEGYLKSRPQRGYFVASARLQEKAGTGEVTVRKQTPPAPPVRYEQIKKAGRFLRWKHIIRKGRIIFPGTNILWV